MESLWALALLLLSALRSEKELELVSRGRCAGGPIRCLKRH